MIMTLVVPAEFQVFAVRRAKMVAGKQDGRSVIAASTRKDILFAYLGFLA